MRILIVEDEFYTLFSFLNKFLIFIASVVFLYLMRYNERDYNEK